MARDAGAGGDPENVELTQGCQDSKEVERLPVSFHCEYVYTYMNLYIYIYIYI